MLLRQIFFFINFICQNKLKHLYVVDCNFSFSVGLHIPQKEEKNLKNSPTVVKSILSKSNATATMTKISFRDSLAEWKCAPILVLET